jgi:hypothetical protein
MRDDDKEEQHRDLPSTIEVALETRIEFVLVADSVFRNPDILFWAVDGTPGGCARILRHVSKCGLIKKLAVHRKLRQGDCAQSATGLQTTGSANRLFTKRRIHNRYYETVEAYQTSRHPKIQ